MKLSVFQRTGLKKSEKKKIRRQGDIPGVLYGSKAKNENVFIKGDEWEKIMRNLPSGRLSTTIFSLSLGNKEHSAIVKDIQYHLTTYKVIHIDFKTLENDKLVTLNVPITCVGVPDCVGIKLGGSLRQVIRALKVECFPKDIPNEFQIDVRDLEIGKMKLLSDLVMPKGVKPLGKMGEVLVLITKHQG